MGKSEKPRAEYAETKGGQKWKPRVGVPTNTSPNNTHFIWQGREVFHIFPKVNVTSNKIIHKKTHHFLDQICIPFLVVWLILSNCYAGGQPKILGSQFSSFNFQFSKTDASNPNLKMVMFKFQSLLQTPAFIPTSFALWVLKTLSASMQWDR